MERELFIHTDPPGGRVFVDGVERGEAPVRMPLAWYGTRSVEVRLDGYRVHCEKLEIEAPWYEVFPLDLISEGLWPFTIHDRREHQVALIRADPALTDDPEAVLERAETLREGP